MTHDCDDYGHKWVYHKNGIYRCQYCGATCEDMNL